jgi:hypothetical protein
MKRMRLDERWTGRGVGERYEEGREMQWESVKLGGLG